MQISKNLGTTVARCCPLPTFASYLSRVFIHFSLRPRHVQPRHRLRRLKPSAPRRRGQPPPARRAARPDRAAGRGRLGPAGDVGGKSPATRARAPASAAGNYSATGPGAASMVRTSRSSAASDGACPAPDSVRAIPTPAISPTPPPPPDPASVSGATAVHVGPLLAGGEAGDGAGEGEEAARHDVEELAVDVAAAAGQCQLEARLRI